MRTGKLLRRSTGSPGEHDDPSGRTDVLERNRARHAWLARAAGVALCVVSIAFVALVLAVLDTHGELALVTRPLPMRIALALPYLVAALALATTAGALLAWRYRYWSLRTRVQQTVLALLGLAFCWQLAALGFLSV